MIAALTLLLVTAPDPRIQLNELRLEGRSEAILAEVERGLAETPEVARAHGFDYLRGRLLENFGREDEAQKAYASALVATPALSGYSRWRMALNQDRMGHPEVAAGLLATLLGGRGAPQPLVPSASRLLVSALQRGGDCRLLSALDSWQLPLPERRSLELARAECALLRGEVERARGLMLQLVRSEPGDEPARRAAQQLIRLPQPAAEPPETALELGRTFHLHRQFELSIRFLSQGLGSAARSDPESRYALARSHFWQADYARAAGEFAALADDLDDPPKKARALYQQGRCLELQGTWDRAADSFRRAHAADPAGRWADAALLSAMRLEWRLGREQPALELLELLASRREWQGILNRAALFLVASDLARERTDRAGRWLELAGRWGKASRIELAYWRGRLAEASSVERAVDHYLEALRGNPLHPLARAADRRLASPDLFEAARERGRRLAASSRPTDLYGAWLLLGDLDPAGEAAREALVRALARDPRSRDFVTLPTPSVANWPLWEARLRQPEELLLALGLWDEGASAILRYFPVRDPALGYTGSRLLALAGETRRSLRVAEILSQRMPADLPPRLVSDELRRLLFPFPYRDLVGSEARRHDTDPHLLAAVIREESRFDPQAISPASARGLTQFVLPTAERLAAELGLGGLGAEDLHRPEISIALGSAYLAELAAGFDHKPHLVLAAYNAGENQARLWRSYCYGTGQDEFFTKVGFLQTREYLAKVLASRAQYAELYPEAAGGSP